MLHVRGALSEAIGYTKHTGKFPRFWSYGDGLSRTAILNYKSLRETGITEKIWKKNLRILGLFIVHGERLNETHI